jgi:hypothetical protein
MRLPSIVDRFETKLAGRLDRWKLLLLGAYTLIYMTGTCVLAARRPLWNDELYTYYMSRLPGFAAVWAALMSGGEQLPPLFFAITRAALRVSGNGSLPLRLPAILGFWVMGLCLFQFVSSRTSTVYGLVAALFPLVTGAYYYAYEARPYGLVLGFGALSLLCWQAATEGRRRLSLALLALSLAAAVSNHYYAVLLYFPLALGEAARTLARRRIDWAIWAAFLISAAPLVLFLPLIRKARAYSGTFWAPPRWVAVPDFYQGLLVPSALLLLALLFLAAIKQTVDSPKLSAAEAGPRARPALHEVVAAAGFVIIPVVAVLLAKFVTRAFTDRYAMPCVIGMGALVALSSHRLLNGRVIWGCMATLCLCGWFTFNEARAFLDLAGAGSKHAQAIKLLQSGADLPIVISDPHTVVEFSYYAPPEITSRMVYLADPSASLRHLGFDSVDRGMRDLVGPWFGVNVADYKQFMARRRQFWVYGNLGFLSWLIDELQKEDVKIELKDHQGGNFLFLVTPREQTDQEDRSL